MSIRFLARALAGVRACFIAGAPLAAHAACPPGGDPLANALCEAEGADAAAADFAKAFAAALKSAQPSVQATILRQQAASKLTLNQTRTFARGGAIFVNFRCAREMIQRRTEALQGVPYNNGAAPQSLGIHFFLVSHYNCAGAKTNFAAATCAAANASADLYAHRKLLAQYGLTVSADQQAALNAQDTSWKRGVARACGAARAFLDFDCVDRAVTARDAALTATMEAPALNPHDNGVFAVRATAMPWFWHAGFNDAYPFGPLDGTGPTIIVLSRPGGVAPSAGTPGRRVFLGAHPFGERGGTGPTVVSLPELGATPGRRIVVEYQSGVIAGSDGKLDTDANGFWNPDSGGIGYGGAPTGKRQSAAICAFTDASGRLVAPPFLLGDGPTVKQVPPGATQLQIGVNQEVGFAENTGGLNISVTRAAGP